MLEKFAQDYQHGASTPDSGRLNLAIMSSMKQLIKTEEVGRIRRDGRQVTGTTEYLASSLTNKNNPLSSVYNLVLIVTDDFKGYEDEEKYVAPYPAGRPWEESAYTRVRDGNGKVVSTPTLDSLVYNLPSKWRSIWAGDKDKRAEERTLWGKRLERHLDYGRVDILLLDGLMVRLRDGIVPENSKLLPTYKGRMLQICEDSTSESHSLTSNGSLLVAPDREDITGPVVKDESRLINSRDETIDSVRYANYLSSKNPLVAAGLYGFALLPETGRLVRENRGRISERGLYEG